MKKIAFILTGLIYITAIVVVAFLGILAEFRNETILVTSIVLEEAKSLAPGRYQTYPEGATVEESDYVIFSRPDESGQGQSEYDIAWNIGGLNFDYVIQVRGYQKIMESPDWKDGKGCFSISALVMPENATKKDLEYAIFEEDGSRSSTTSVSSEGLISFGSPRQGVFSIDALISSTDTSYVNCRAHFVLVGY